MTSNRQFQFINPSARLGLALVTLILAGCASMPTVDLAAMSEAELRNYSAQEGLVFASGQPSPEQLAVVADAGIQHVISLRTPGEIDWDEAQVVESQGMMFHSLPVSGRTGITPENSSSLEALLASLDGQPVLVHCGSSNRVGALKALNSRIADKASVEDALAEGRRWGLTSLEERVETILVNN